ncbi:MAG: hypothetical protein K8R02_07770 [Anaerohalosphaeraceae bacterium]|nr:hypothetical protein [Anaerohalosphaeraceae bacterium]
MKNMEMISIKMDMAHFIDWHDEFKESPDKWMNHGRRMAEDSCQHKIQDKDGSSRETNMRYSGYCEQCGFSEDDCEPMMNYGYPLCYLPEEDKIVKIVKNTCLTVMENQNTGEYFLVLCGGGMNLSQSIAHAYLLAGHRIPDELAFEVCTQPCLSVGKKEYVEIMKECKCELENIQRRADERIKKIMDSLKTVE